MLLVVGRVLRPHGIRGEVVVEVRTDDPGQRFASGRVLCSEPEALGPLTVASTRPHAGGLIVGFSGVTDRDAAQRLRGTLLVIDSADVPMPDGPDEFHDAQLIGLDVLTVDGRRVGTVADVRHHGQDLLVIRRDMQTADNPKDPERLPLRDTADPRFPGSRGAGMGGEGGGTAAQAVKDQNGGPRPAGVSDPGPGGEGEELLVPFVAAIVPEVDLRAGRLLIDPPAGLLGDHEV